MRFTQSWLAAGAIVLSMTLPNSSGARSALDSRVERLENIVENELNISLINQLEEMQKEIRELRGQIEEQRHSMQNAHRVNVIEAKPVEAIPEEEPSLVTAEPVPQPTSDIVAIPEDMQIPEEQTEKSAYDLAYRSMNNKKYQLALTEFKDLLWQYPDGIYAPNAYYWMGEIYLSQWQQDRTNGSLLLEAKQAFTTVLDKYKAHHKAVDALLKLGFIEIDQENWSAAKDLLSRVIKEHPGTSRARLAEARLQRMQQEGRL